MTLSSPLTSPSPIDTVQGGPQPKHQGRKIIKQLFSKDLEYLTTSPTESRGSQYTKPIIIERCSHTEVSTEAGLQRDGVTGHGSHLLQEPSPNSPFSVTLVLRLPDGTRIQRRFNYRTDILHTVVVFGIQYLKSIDLSEDCVELSSCTVPKIVHNDLSLTLEQAGLVHNTILCLTVL